MPDHRLAQYAATSNLLPVFAIIYGMLFLGESVTPWMLSCGAVIVLGTVLSTGALASPRSGALREQPVERR